MRSAPAPLITLLNTSQQLVYADLYTIILSGGQVLRYTSHDRPITVNSNTFTLGPMFKRSRTRLSVGVSVDTLDMTVAADNTVQVNSVPFLRFVASGGLDGARLRLERVFAADWNTAPAGTIILFAGRINNVTMNRYEAQVTVNSDLELLDAKVPRNLYQPGCLNTLYDATCGVNRAGLTVTGSVTNTPAPTRSLFDTTLTQATGYFSLGVLTFTSGQNNGIARTLRAYDSTGLVTPIAPFPFAPAVGDTFSVYPGCDKTMSTCTSRFSNIIRFRGQPFVPVPETVT